MTPDAMRRWSGCDDCVVVAMEAVISDSANDGAEFLSSFAVLLSLT
jgi:hypothetical protein